MFNDCLRAARERTGRGQVAVSQDLGIEQTQLSRYERGLHVPSLSMLEKMADVYGVSLDQLCGREPLPAKPSEEASA